MTSATHTNIPGSDFERVGGTPAVIAVVDEFYDRVVSDPELEVFFRTVDLTNLRRHQVQLISQVLGGPVTYDGSDLKVAHADLAIEPQHFQRVATHLVATLQSAEVDADIIERVGGVLAAAEPDIVTAGS